MIYTLNYPSHPLERVNQVVFEFLKNSIPSNSYSRNLFPDWFKDVMKNSKAKTGEKSFEDKFKDVHNEIQKLPQSTRQSLFNEFNLGLDIKSLCDDKTKSVILSENYSIDLHEVLKSLFKDHFFGIALKKNLTIQTKLNTSLKDHYISFKKINNSGRVCPFCGLHEYALIEGEPQDDYDHWLYKDKYPLYAINFSNLVPMCDKCNKAGVKGTADVLHHSNGTRRESFYPYDFNNGVNINVESYEEIDKLSLEQQKKFPFGYFKLNVIQVEDNESEKVETWKSVFKIEARFNSYLSEYPNTIKDEFHDEYLPSKGIPKLPYKLSKLRIIIQDFKNQLGSPKRRTGVEIYKAYLDFICKPDNEHILYTFCNINPLANKNKLKPEVILNLIKRWISN